MLFGIGGGELLALLLAAVILLGPEKIPEFSKKAARVVHYLRNVANTATDHIKQELGPEYADLDLKDLNPKTLLQKTLLDDIQEDLEEIKADLTEVKADLDLSAKTVSEEVREVVTEVNVAVTPAKTVSFVSVRTVPFDVEAT